MIMSIIHIKCIPITTLTVPGPHRRGHLSVQRAGQGEHQAAAALLRAGLQVPGARIHGQALRQGETLNMIIFSILTFKILTNLFRCVISEMRAEGRSPATPTSS